jgi:eukaryotic-like serine/threonine-protein kinase
VTYATQGGFAPGSTLGTYRLERLLGRGGTGAVFLAYDTRLHRQVALKVLENEPDDSTSAARLLREARNAAALNHPHICAVHELGESGGAPYIAMEFVGGRSLRERIDSGALTVKEAVRLGIQAADALDYAHARGVVHRDFKAANVIVDDDGRLKVIDFGLARRDQARLAETPTMSSVVPAGMVAGTPYAMAPEQVRAEAADSRTDIWALGVLLYEMAAGAAPFKEPTVAALFSAILTRPPAPLPGTVPASLRAVIERCLEKDPANRFQSAGNVRLALERIDAGLVPPWVTWAYHLRRRPIRTATAAIALAVVVLVALNVGGARDRLLGAGDHRIKLAVLPFENLTGSADQEYFSDGLTDEMIMQLGRLQPQQLSVIARTSSMRYKQRHVPIDQIARELGVDYVMEGSARREGNRVRINATLIKARGQSRLWEQTFERELSNILALQSDVASGVARALVLKLLPADQARLAAARPVNPDAYEAYLKGRFQWQTLRPQAIEAAMTYFELAVQKDSNYAAPWTGMGTVWGLRCTNGRVRCRDALARWKESIDKARALDSASLEVQSHKAAIAYFVDWDWAAADREFKRAIDLGSTNPDTYMWYADFLGNVAGRRGEAIAQARRAVAMDPQNSLYKIRLAVALMDARREDDGIAVLRQILKDDPTARPASINLTYALARQGKANEAFQLMQAGNANNPGVLEALKRAFAEGGLPRAIRVRADRMAEEARRSYVSPAGIAAQYARAGEKTLALDWLEKAYDEHEPIMTGLNGREWDAMRDEPRFAVMVRRMKYPSVSAQR